MTKILITGATGFIGSSFYKEFKSLYNITALVRPSTDCTELNKYGIKVITYDGDPQKLASDIRAEHISGIVHFASLYLKEHTSEQIEDLIASNVTFPTQLLEASIKAKVRWFLNTGSFWQHFQDNPYSPVNLYAATKQAFLSIAQYYRETSDIKITTLSLSDTYGPGDTRPKIFNLWRKIADSGEELKMSGGDQIMDTTYISDVISAYKLLIDLLESDNIKLLPEYAVSSEQRVTLKDLSHLYEQVTEKKLHIIWGAVPYRHREVMMPWSGGCVVPGWKPMISLDEGIKMINKDF